MDRGIWIAITIHIERVVGSLNKFKSLKLKKSLFTNNNCLKLNITKTIYNYKYNINITII